MEDMHDQSLILFIILACITDVLVMLSFTLSSL